MRRKLFFLLSLEFFAYQVFAANILLIKETKSLDEGGVPIHTCTIDIEAKTIKFWDMPYMGAGRDEIIKKNDLGSYLDKFISVVSSSDEIAQLRPYLNSSPLTRFFYLYLQISKQKYIVQAPAYQWEKSLAGGEALPTSFGISWTILNGVKLTPLKNWGYLGFGQIDSSEAKILIALMDELCEGQSSVDDLPNVLLRSLIEASQPL